MNQTFWNDAEFRHRLIAFLCKDRRFLKETSELITVEDFKNESRERALVATAAIEYYMKYREPIGKLLKAEVLDISNRQHLSQTEQKEVLEYVRKVRKTSLAAVDAITDKVLQFKKEKAKAQAIQQLINLQGAGDLSDEKFTSICQKAIIDVKRDTIISDYFEELEDRINKRAIAPDEKLPLLFIDCYDSWMRGIGRGHLGVALAPTSRGKSLFLIHVAKAYCLQGYKVIYVTLEDPIADVENRFDASVTAIAMDRLAKEPKNVRRLFNEHKRLVRGRLKIVDGTEGGMSVQKITDIFEQLKNQGFHADCIIVDYDDEIHPPKKQSERRMEFADIYRELRVMAGKHDLIVWTAAQTQRKTTELKILSEDTVAEDFSKIRKATLVISLGKGDWGDNSIYLYVVKHRNDKRHLGWNIVCDLDASRVYDRDATREREKLELSQMEVVDV